MVKEMKDWNVPGVAIGIVYKDKLIFSKGYGYRDYEKKLPMNPSTLFMIASNTKLFTAVSIGILVEQGKLEWDKPIRNYVPSMQFYDTDLNNEVTIRDMLSHRTGISSHLYLWYETNFTRKELFERIKYLEPISPIRENFHYNNLLYEASGYIIELLSSRSYEQFLQENILGPLDMNRTLFSTEQMRADENHAEPYDQKKDTTLLYKIPIYEDIDHEALGSAGSLISTVDDLSKWVILLLNNGSYQHRQIVPKNSVKETSQPTIYCTFLDNLIKKGIL